MTSYSTILLHTRSPWKKFEKHSKLLVGFHFKAHKTRRSVVLSRQHATTCPHGVYISAHKPDFLMAIHPSENHDRAGKLIPYLFADHVSIPYNANNRMVDLHHTTYVPDPGFLQPTQGIESYFWMKFKDGSCLPIRDYKDCSFLNNSFIWSGLMLDVLRYPYVDHDFDFLYEEEEKVHAIGGVKRARQLIIVKEREKKQRVRSVLSSRTPIVQTVNKTFHKKTLETLWHTLKIKRVDIITIRCKSGKMWASCFIADDFSKQFYQQSKCIGFEVKSDVHVLKQVMKPLIHMLHEQKIDWTGKDMTLSINRM